MDYSGDESESELLSDDDEKEDGEDEQLYSEARQAQAEVGPGDPRQFTDMIERAFAMSTRARAAARRATDRQQPLTTAAPSHKRSWR